MILWLEWNAMNCDGLALMLSKWCLTWLLTEQIFSHISSQPAFSWKLRARSKLSPSDQTMRVSCCFWYAVSFWILDSKSREPADKSRQEDKGQIRSRPKFLGLFLNYRPLPPWRAGKFLWVSRRRCWRRGRCLCRPIAVPRSARTTWLFAGCPSYRTNQVIIMVGLKKKLKNKQEKIKTCQK